MTIKLIIAHGGIQVTENLKLVQFQYIWNGNHVGSWVGKKGKTRSQVVIILNASKGFTGKGTGDIMELKNIYTEFLSLLYIFKW